MDNTEIPMFVSGPFLEEKLGKSVFDSIPQQPGVYRFYDAFNNLLYVGKAKNLRTRLFTYKRAAPGKTTSKEASLIRRIHRLEYNVLHSEKEALLVENSWIRRYRPEFNHQNKLTETYYYIILFRTDCGFGLEYNMLPAIPIYSHYTDNLQLKNLKTPKIKILSAKLFGCYKGHSRVRTHLGNLLRLLWFVLNETTKPANLPTQLLRNLTPNRYFYTLKPHQHIFADDLQAGLTDWFKGVSPKFIYQLIQSLQPIESVFQQEYFRSVVEQLFKYFDQTLVPYGDLVKMKKRNGQPCLIYQNELDDLLVQIQFAKPK